MALSLRLRFDCFKRDSFKCQYCGRTPPAVILEVDHIVPVSKGGSDDSINLITACFDCNLGKSNIELEDAPETVNDAMVRTRDAAERELERRTQAEWYNDFLMECRRRDNEVIESLGRYWFNQFESEKDKFIFGNERHRSIKVFLTKLTAAEIMEGMDIAFSKFVTISNRDNKTWRYFCGVCWNKIKRMEAKPDAMD